MMRFLLQKKLQAAYGIMELNVSCEIEQGQFVSLYGSSGAGKTSVLRMLAGFLKAEEGFVEVNKQEWFNSDKKINLPSQKRKIGFVFQDNALFQNMSVKQNLEFALDKGASKAIIEELMYVVALEGFHNRRVQTLSGGQKQRVALARALVRRPELLMLDEPLSATDYEMRMKLQNTLLDIHRRYQLITILVSHDIPEIVRLCDQTILLDNGRMINKGEPAEVFFPQQLNRNFNFSGNIIKIKNEGTLFRVSILVGNQVMDIQIAEEQLAGLSKGDSVSVSANEFNPEVKKL